MKLSRTSFTFSNVVAAGFFGGCAGGAAFFGIEVAAFFAGFFTATGFTTGVTLDFFAGAAARGAFFMART
ncbi:MAG: hypothetical protein EAZ21_10280 [Betaproteobacteria bacterium]|nr:MAG: hypothetical protein EAZ21_10280 [Betaproteobacteria bacterium]